MDSDNFFDRSAIEWDSKPITREMTAIFADEIAKKIDLTRDMTLLEFGCGTGQIGIQFSSHVNRIKMLDTSLGMLNVLKEKIAEKNIDNIDLIFGDIFETQLEKHSFDMIYALMSVHHVDDVTSLFKRFGALLKHGGYLCIGDLETEDGSFHQHKQYIHNGFDPMELKSMLRNSNYRSIDSFRMHVVSKPDINGDIKEYPMFFIKAEKR